MWTGLALPALLLAATPAARSAGFDRAIERALPRVVKLYGLGAGLQRGYGTGMLVSEDGLVLTVLSLLIDARVVRAVTANGEHYEADVVYRDPATQLALLRLKPPNTTGRATDVTYSAGSFAYFDLTDSATLKPGDWVIAVGNPFKVADGAEPMSVSHGVFSTRTRLDARRRAVDFPYRGEVLVIDAITANPGAPGSALVNLEGNLVGMIGRVVVSNLTHTQFNYAMPRDVLHAFLVEATSEAQGAEDASTIATSAETVEHAGGDDAAALAGLARLGTTDNGERDEEQETDFGIRMVKAGYRTVLPFVERVRRESPADRAGVRKDDLILSVNGKEIRDVDDYKLRMGQVLPKEPVDLVIRRGRRILTVRLEPEQP